MHCKNACCAPKGARTYWPRQSCITRLPLPKHSSTDGDDMTPITAARIGRPMAALVCAVFLGLPGAASAFNEIEPNNDWVTAQSISNFSGDFFIDGSRPFADGSDDFFTFTVRAPGLLRIES